MVKKEALSSDLKFIKEVEELKIKQKLLIESLKRKNSDEQNKLFLEINSKLDFLVNIFNEANKPTDSATEGEEDSQFTPVFEKIDELTDTINKRLTDIEAKIASVNGVKKSIDSGDKFKDETKKEGLIPPKMQDEKKPELKAPPLEDAPVPDFKSEIKEKNDSKEEPKKKKKWF